MSTASTIYGVKPSPRVLVFGYAGDDSAAFAATLDFVATIEFADWSNVDGFRLAEWDALLCFGAVPRTPPNSPPIHKVVIGGDDIGVMDASTEQHPGRLIYIFRRDVSVAREIHVPEVMRPSIEKLVRTDLLPRFQTNESPNFAWNHNAGFIQPITASSDYVDAFVFDGDLKILAGSLLCSDGAFHWHLPEGADSAAWLRTALEVWSLNDTKLTPLGTWVDSRRWMTHEQLRIESDRERAEATFREQKAAYEETILALDKQKVAADKSASTDCQRLLTAQGDSLAAAVADALRELGFVVTNMDEQAEKGVKLEDLQVSSGDAFVALVEVRGYTGGAKTGDLLRLGQITNRYVLRTGTEPSSIWYVVNQFIDRDPSQRDEPLVSRPEDVATFSEGSGAVIDTRTLYDLLTDFRAGAITQEDASSILRSATMTLQYTPRRT